jgi:hypothetical protein
MSELRYPNESREYRDARDSLLKDEQELSDKVKSVATCLLNDGFVGLTNGQGHSCLNFAPFLRGAARAVIAAS